MSKFVLVYTGGQMAETPEEQEASMQAWGAWFGQLGSAVLDMGNPFGASATASGSGIAEGGSAKLTGYSIVSADSLDAATALTAGCPLLTSGGAIDVYEAVEM
jgi:hypothetical protein